MRFGTRAPGVYDPQTRRLYLKHEMAHGRIADAGDAAVLPTNVVHNHLIGAYNCAGSVVG